MPQSTPELIINSRITVIAGEAFFEHITDLQRVVPDRFWMPSDFGEIFGKLRGGSGHPRFAFPWRNSQKSAFWRNYCEGIPLSQVSAEAAMRLVAPLRLMPSPQPLVRTDDGRERVFYDIYGYPFGLVAALTVQQPGRAPLDLDAWRDRLRALRLSACFSIDAPGGPPVVGLTASEVLSQLLDWYRTDYFGQIAQRAVSNDPFSIVTVIQGEGFDPQEKLSARTDLQRLLTAVTSWPMNWQATTPLPLDQACLPVSDANAAPGDALYAAKRGRTIWRPALFTFNPPPGARLHTLSCLMHNQVAGLVQSEALKLYAAALAAMDKQQAALISARQRANVATQIDRLWRGQRTYRSSSIQRAIADKSTLAEVNALVVEAGLAQLS